MATTKYRIIKNPPYDSGAVESYWIEKTTKTFFGLIKLRKIYGDYSYNNGGAMAEMPFFNKCEAKRRIRIFKSR